MNSLKKYTSIPELRQVYQQAISTVEKETMYEKKTLTREQVLDGVQFIETAKLNQFMQAFNAIAKDKTARQLLDSLKVSKSVIEDDLFNKFQFEAIDVVTNVKEQNLMEDAELKGILNELKIKRLEFIRDADQDHLGKVIKMERFAMKKLGIIEDDDDYETEEEEEVIEGVQQAAAAAQ